jgi:arginyl-tRNA synthetase
LFLQIQQQIKAQFQSAVREAFGIETGEPALGFPPGAEMGEISVAACFELAKQLRQAPREIAAQILPKLLPLEGVRRVAIAGGGYLNFFLDRAALTLDIFRLRTGLGTALPAPPKAKPGKILVEHTSINPNKAAHIGHLRNAVLGDTFARLLSFRGHLVEVQNYIDNTGVQVADVVVGFARLEKKSPEEVRALARSQNLRFDYYCWDLYSRVSQQYEMDPDLAAFRAKTLKAIEENDGKLAELGGIVSTAIARIHLETMVRINVRYHLLVQESEILRLKFWQSAFELMKQKGAIRLEKSGKNQGCWVMPLGGEDGKESGADAGEEDAKIIVRSNGTVTYVGKDIAYHLWKFGLLGKDFAYRPFYEYADGQTVWQTAVEGVVDHPEFGKATEAFAVIDTRQSYVQDVVRGALRALGHGAQADRLHHFAYEVVGLSPRCAQELGVEVAAGDEDRSYIEVSGRRGLGIKADDLMDRLFEKALLEVQVRESSPSHDEQQDAARQIAVGALRYFLVKFTRRTIIAFDFKEALAFEGETGPYLQYTAVRAKNILRKFAEIHVDYKPRALLESTGAAQLESFLNGPESGDFWDLVLLGAQLEMVADQSIAAEEPATLAKYSFRLAQAFNNFYHHYRILQEPDATRQTCLLILVEIVLKTLEQALYLMGIEIPARM